ncbi:MAG: hypothetical protein H6708_25920 [Kofleriaceae bacterium]|nr:hypothetical protein [Myxococcales bacterium]MCB9563847.1 hypothetical protein [Kofleriaceae bacterium]
MIPIPAGWARIAAPRGFQLVPPGPPGSGSIQYIERLRPIASTADLVAGIGAPAGFVDAAATEVEHGVTDEGELTELHRRRGAIDGADVELHAGFVLLDDHYAQLTSVSVGAERHGALRAVVRTLLRRDAHLLGRVRRRRYRFAPPSGWRITAEAFSAHLAPPDERDPARLHVAAALPRHPELAESTLELLCGGPRQRAAATITTTPCHTTVGLAGTRHTLDSGARRTHLVFLFDAQFAYGVRLAGGVDDAHLPALHALLESIEPIAMPGAPSREAVSALLPWVD